MTCFSRLCDERGCQELPGCDLLSKKSHPCPTMNTSASSPFPSDRPIDSTGFLAEAADTTKAAERLRTPSRTVVDESKPSVDIPTPFMAAMTAYLRMFLRNATAATYPGFDPLREELIGMVSILYTKPQMDVTDAKNQWTHFWNENMLALLKLPHPAKETSDWLFKCGEGLRQFLRDKFKLDDPDQSSFHRLARLLQEYMVAMLPAESVVTMASLVPLVELLLKNSTTVHAAYHELWTDFWLKRGWRLLPPVGASFIQYVPFNAENLLVTVGKELKDFISEKSMQEASNNLDTAMQNLREVAEERTPGMRAQPVEALDPVSTQRIGEVMFVPSATVSKPRSFDPDDHVLVHQVVDIWKEVVWPSLASHNNYIPPLTALILLPRLIQTIPTLSGKPWTSGDLLLLVRELLIVECSYWQRQGFSKRDEYSAKLQKLSDNPAWLYLHRAAKVLFDGLNTQPGLRSLNPVDAPTRYSVLSLRLRIYANVEEAVLRSLADTPLGSELARPDTAAVLALHAVIQPLLTELQKPLTNHTTADNFDEHSKLLQDCLKELKAGSPALFNAEALRIYVS